MSHDTLSDFVEATAAKFGIPGVAVGVWADGREVYACHGVTSVDNPLPVDRDTLYVLGSVTKTVTATALMRLVAEGRVDLDAPVRRYVPELRLKDERAAAEITVSQLLNHTSGLDWGFTSDTGEGDDALAGYVAKMAELELIAPPGTRASYSQAGYNLVGRIVEKVTGLTFERAVATLLFEPLGLLHSFFARDDVMTRRFVVGHNRGEDGTLSIARLWRRWRGENPGGGLVSSAADQLRWARFHLGDGRAGSGERVLPAEVLHRMREPTIALRASSLGDAIGIGWFLRDVGGVRTVGHGGSANGQFAELVTVPERNFAVVSLSNAGPDGIQFNQAAVRFALQTYLDVVDRGAQPLPYDPTRAGEIVGHYQNEVMTLTIDTDGAGLRLDVRMKPEIRAAADKELPPDYPPAGVGLLPGDGDEYVLTDGGMQGLRGFFTRDESGAVVGIDLAGRLFNRVVPGDPLP
jgi:CubicO group peptidase (beta-lactamase class C family)